MEQVTLNKAELGLGGGSLLQVANRSLTQMMSYIIDTPHEEVIVMDGGNYCAEDGEHLYEQLKAKGGRVSMWFITHAHSDHLGALMWILKNYPEGSIVIEKLCFHFPETEWLVRMEEAEINMEFLELIKTHKINVVTTCAGEVMECDGISVEVINDPIVQDDFPSINPTGIILVVHFPKRDVLFLGDFDVYAQTEFLEKYDVSKIRKEIVQMAHHGQKGVDFSFYRLIQPKICLYTAPQWLWENNKYRCTDPASAGTGPFAIMETRRWMEELGAEQSYTHGEGDYVFV